MRHPFLGMGFALAASLPAAAAESGCIREWLLLGPFKEDDVAVRLKAPRIPDEEGAVPQPGESAGGLTWKAHRSPADTIDLLSDAVGFAQRSNAVAYAFVCVSSAAPREAWLRMGSDDGIAVWLNGEPVWFNDAARPQTPDQDAAAVKLQQGWNVVLAKISQGVGPWSFTARFTDAAGAPLEGLQTALQVQPGQAPPAPPAHPVQTLGIRLGPLSVGKDGAVRCTASARVRNLGADPVANASVGLCLEPGKPVAPFQETGAFRGWERRDVGAALPLDDLLALVKAGNPGIEVRVGDQVLYAAVKGDLPHRVFHAALGPARVESWRLLNANAPGAEQPTFDDAALASVEPGKEVTPAGPVLWLRARVVLPAPFAGAAFAVEVDRGAAKADVYVNGTPAPEGGAGAVPLPAGAADCLIAVKVAADNARPIVVPPAAVGLADPSARACLRSLEMFEQIFPDLKGEVLQAKEKAAAALAEKGAGGFLPALAELAALVQDRSRGIKDYTAWYVGQSHIDLVWLWRWEDSIQIFKDTFGQALQFIEEHPRCTYAQSQAAAYLATEQHHPELFEKIRKAVKDGRWSVVGGMWVEPDLNMLSGESAVRQLLYGKRYFLEKFGVDVKVGWNPDAFGHGGQLPQILKKSGVDYYFFTRCGRDRRLFWWEAPDGSRVLCQAASAPASPAAVHLLKTAERQYGVKDVMNLYGAGDRGGGPTRDDLKRIDGLRAAEMFPSVDYGVPEKVFPLMEKTARQIPVVKEEMNCVYEGCYTTHGRTKRANRWSENLLGSAEAAAAIAQDFGAPYGRKPFEQYWRLVLFNQFHHLLTGTGFHDIYLDAEKDYARVFRVGEQLRRSALDAIAAQVKTAGEGIPVFVFNTLGWARTDVAEAEVPHQGPLGTVGVFDEAGNEVPSQVVPGGAGFQPVRVLFLAQDLPALGYRVYWVRDAGAKKKDFPPVAAAREKVESDRFVLELDPASGCILRLFDKAASKEVMAPGTAGGNGDAKLPGGNLLQLQGDRGALSAWVITYTGEQWNVDRDAKVQVVERGPVRAVLRVTRTFKDERPDYTFGQPSTFQQDLILYNGIGRIDLVHDIDWHERYKILKLAFPVGVEAAAATAEIPYGTAERPTKGADYPMLNWIDLSDGKYGVGVLNNGRHGYDVNGNVMRVHLLRASFDPDPEPDRGNHRFVLSLAPHAGGWRQAGMPRRGAELNQPPVAWMTAPHGGTLPSSASFASVEPANVMFGALKRAEDSDAVIVRVVETDGAAGATARVRLWKPLAKAVETDLLERDLKELPVAGDVVEFPIGPYEIKTVKVELK